ncbi:MAG: hypothetical protein OXM57_00540 [bacterium]|nr:hypothetical protein [bacterium]MDE0351169.1 hypothetical protein [bacterium]
MSEPVPEGGQHRVKADRLRELSDAEFVELLRETHGDRGWTIAQLIELERRGTHLVEGDPFLFQAFEEQTRKVRDALGTLAAGAFSGLEEQQRAVGDVLSGFTEQWSSIRERMADLAPVFPKTQFPLVSPPPSELDPLLPEFESLPRLPPPPSLEMQVAQIEVLSEIRQEIQNARKRDWVDWLNVGLVAVAALVMAISEIPRS